MKSLIFVLSILAGHLACQVYQPIAFPEKVDKKYIFNSLKEKEKYTKKVKSSIPKKYLEQYTFAQTFGKTEMFSSGQIYLSWPAMENYVNRILDSIIPSNLASKKIKAYIGRSSAINAFCLYDGTMIVNVGLLAEVKNEAALASIMGHELGHFIKSHHLNQFRKKTKKHKNNELEEKLNMMGYSQENELEADQEGFSIAKNAGYDVEEGNSNFELFIREQEYHEKRNKSALANTDSVTVSTKAGKFKANTLEKLLSTHPDMKDRKEKLNAYLKANPQVKRSKFKMDPEYFSALQTQARLESISLLFNTNDYHECLERSFIYYLYNPDELTYTWYVAESIRRLCLLDYKLRKKGFLTEKLVNDGFKEGEGILHDIKFLVPNSEKFKQVKAKEMQVMPYAFETYKDAFYYFTKKLIDKKYNEAYLSRALFENNKNKISENVNKYISGPFPKYKDYAINYMNKTLTDKIASNSKEIVMIPKVNFFRHYSFNQSYSYGDADYYYQKSEIVGTEMSSAFANNFNSNLSDAKAISMTQAATENFNTKYKYETIINRTMLARRDENEGYQVVHYYKELEDEDYNGKIDIFRLDPETWEFFKSNEIDAISYAIYSRHLSRGARKIRNTMLILAIPTTGLTALIALGITVNYKMLTLFSYDTKLGALYYDSSVKGYRLNSKRALKMFRSMKKDKKTYIKDYNDRYATASN